MSDQAAIIVIVLTPFLAAIVLGAIVGTLEEAWEYFKERRKGGR